MQDRSELHDFLLDTAGEEQWLTLKTSEALIDIGELALNSGVGLSTVQSHLIVLVKAVKTHNNEK